MNKNSKKRERPKQSGRYQPKVAIPLPFDQAIGGLLAVKPSRPKTAKPKK